MRVIEFIASALSGAGAGPVSSTIPFDAVSLGLYTGVTAAYIYLVILYRRGESELPPAPVTILMYCSLALLLVDELLAVLGSPSPANFRVALGLVSGASLAVILFTSVSMGTLRLPTYRRVLNDPWSITLLGGLILGLFWLTGQKTDFTAGLLTVMAALGVMILFTSLNLYGLFCLGRRRPTPEERIRIGFMVFISIVMAANEILFISLARGVLQNYL